MSDVLLEMDEAMRQERMANLWKNYGSYIIGFIVLTILGTAVFAGDQSWRENRRIEQTDALISIQENPSYPDNVLNGEADINALDGSVRGLLLLGAAGSLMDLERADDALGVYERAAVDTEIDQQFRQLAGLMVVRLSLGQDDADKDELLGYLTPIVADKTSSWRLHALLESALVKAHLGLDYQGAIEDLAIIEAQENAPQSLQEKVKALSALYTLKLNSGVQ